MIEPIRTANPPLFVIRPAATWEGVGLSELWEYRHVFSVFLWRNVMRRYRQTLLGPLWFVLSPLLRMGVFTALGSIAGLPSDGVPYSVFTYAALLPWELFATGINRSGNGLVEYEHILSRVYFPRLLLPLTEVTTALVDFAISFGILLAMSTYYGFAFSSRLLVLPLLIVLTMALSLAVGLFIAPLQARYRDTSNLMSYVVQFWFFGTPVAYSASILTNRLPAGLSQLYRLNPMNGVVEGFRWALLGTGRAPDSALVATSFIVFVVLFVGAIVFRKTEHSIVDVI
jgi:homopolymeric O-antigen transport system permease protein